jgi:hypothetical protein
MKFTPLAGLRLLVSGLVLCCYTVTFVGCSGNSSPDSTTMTDSDDHDDHDHDDHVHDDHDEHAEEGHEGHDHAPHGPHGGHMVDLSGGTHAEWTHDDQKDEVVVYVENPESVEKVSMKVTIEGETTEYALQPNEEGTEYQIVSPDLLFAIKMGDSVETDLIVTTADGQATGAVEHHAH